jgi:hypothetical protein
MYASNPDAVGMEERLTAPALAEERRLLEPDQAAALQKESVELEAQAVRKRREESEANVGLSRAKTANAGLRTGNEKLARALSGARSGGGDRGSEERNARAAAR